MNKLKLIVKTPLTPGLIPDVELIDLDTNKNVVADIHLTAISFKIDAKSKQPRVVLEFIPERFEMEFDKNYIKMKKAIKTNPRKVKVNAP